MTGHARIFSFIFLLLATWSHADHVIVTGGPALRKWEDFRVKNDQHDRWWANFVRASTLKIDELRASHGAGARVVWMVYKPGYQARGREDGKPYIAWIGEQAAKRGVTLVWFNGTGNFISALNSRPRGSVETFDFFGHSNRHAFMFDYGSDIMAASTAWLHERDLPRVKASIFAPGANCKSWGCHTGTSMSAVWKRATGVALIGANGPTDYTVVGRGKMPVVIGSWSR